jgi:hypothetical protein
VRTGAKGLVDAHLALLREELAIAGRELAIIVALALVAFVLACLLVTLLYVGSFLFLGEWLFGSMGWGILHGSLLTVAIIELIGLNLAGGWSGASWRGLLIALVLGILLAILFASNVMRDAAVNVSQQLHPSIAIEPPLLAVFTVALIGAVVGAIALFVLGLVIGSRNPLTAFGLVYGFVVGFVIGSAVVDPSWLPVLVGGIAGAVVLGLILMIVGYRSKMAFRLLLVGLAVGFFIGCIFGFVTFDTKGAIALAIAIGLVLWMAAAAALAARRGFDPKKRYEKLIPSQTMAEIQETKTYVEQQWQRQRRNLSGR